MFQMFSQQINQYQNVYRLEYINKIIDARYE